MIRLFFPVLLASLATISCKTRQWNNDSDVKNIDAQSLNRDGSAQNIKAGKIEFSMDSELFAGTINLSETEPKVNWKKTIESGIIRYELDLPNSKNPLSHFECSRPDPKRPDAKPGEFTTTKCSLRFAKSSGNAVDGKPCFYTFELKGQPPSGAVNCGYKRGDRAVAYNEKGQAVAIDKIVFTKEESTVLYNSIKIRGVEQRWKGAAPAAGEIPETYQNNNWLECKVLPENTTPPTFKPVECALNAPTHI